MTTTKLQLAGRFSKDSAGYIGEDGKVYPYSFDGDKKRYVVIRKSGKSGDMVPCTFDGTMRVTSLRGNAGDSIHMSETQPSGMVVDNTMDGGIGYLIKDGVMHKYDNFLVGDSSTRTVIYVISAVVVGNVVYKLANGGSYANAPAEVWDLADNTVEAKATSDLMVVTSVGAALSTVTAARNNEEVAYDFSAVAGAGTPLYLNTNGTITDTVPSTSGHFVRVVARANVTTIQVDIDPSWSEIA